MSSREEQEKQQPEAEGEGLDEPEGVARTEAQLEEGASKKTKSPSVSVPSASPLKKKSSLIADEASEDSDEGSDQVEGKKKKKKNLRNESESEDEEEEDEDLDEYEKDDFVVEDGDEEEAGAGKRKSKRARTQGEGDGSEDDGEDDDGDEDEDDDEDEDSDDEVEEFDEFGEGGEEDYDAAGGKQRKRKRRLKKLGSDAAGGSSSGGAEAKKADKPMTEEELRTKLFGRTDLEDLEDEEQEKKEEDKMDDDISDGEEFDSESDEDDEFKDFIDDTEVHKQRVVTDDMDDEQRRIAIEREEQRLRKQRKKQKRKQKMRAKDLGLHVTSSGLRDGYQIFGDPDEMLRTYETQKAKRVESEAKAKSEREVGGRNEFERKLEPSLFESKFFTNDDDMIRETDMPERFQLDNLHAVEASVGEFSEQCEWICDHLMGNNCFNKDQYLYRDILEKGIIEEESPSTLSSKQQMLGRRVLKRKSEKDASSHEVSQDEQEALKKALLSVIKDLQVQSLEVPFIAMYRKDHCGPLLGLREEDSPPQLGSDDLYDVYEAGFAFTEESVMRPRARRWDLLWKVYSLSAEWHSYFKRAQKRIETYKVLQSRAQEAGRDDIVTSLGGCIDMLQSKNFGAQVIDDADAKYKLCQSIMQNLDTEKAFTSKRPGRTQQLSHWRKVVPEALMKVICLSPSEFAENLMCANQAFKPEDAAMGPMEFVEREATDVSDSNLEHILDTAKKLAAIELASDTTIRQIVREVYRANAVVSTKPTKAGLTIRDPLHMYCPVSYLEDKPLYLFKEAEWLYLMSAEREGYITVKINVPNEVLDEQIFDFFRDKYFSSSQGSTVKEWNACRKEILDNALYSNLLPMLRLEAKNALYNEAKGWVSQKISDELWKILSDSPWAPYTGDTESDADEKYVMACVWGPAKDASQGFSTTLAMLDSEGGLVDFMSAPTFSGPLHWVGDAKNVLTDIKSQAAALEITKFLVLHRPQVIALGSGSVECLKLKLVLEEIIGGVVQNHAQEMKGALQGGDIPVILAPQAIPHLWTTSLAASSEYSNNVSEIVKESIALGRMFIDPLPVTASLFSQEKEIAGLRLNEAERFLDPEERISALEKCMITIVNQVGVDLNDIVKQTWKSYSLQFVAGLGPRKADELVQAIKRNGGYVSSRNQIQDYSMLGPKIWENACATFKFNADKVDSDEAELLDTTRIHPESYEAVKKLANKLDPDREESEALEHIMKKTMSIKSNSVNEIIDKYHFKEYADDPANKVTLKTLIDFAFELKNPFSEVRDEWRMATASKEFELISSDIRDRIKEGRLCNATVLYSRGLFKETNDGMEPLRDMFIVELDSGVLAYLATGDRLKRSEKIPVRVLNVKPSKISFKHTYTKNFAQKKEEIDMFDIEVGNSETDLTDLKRWEDKYCKDHFYRHIDLEKEAAADMPKQKRTKFIPRPIKHVFFENVDYFEMKEKMEKKETPKYTYLFRPSSEGVGTLSLSMKLQIEPIIIMNEKIVEKDRSSRLELGPPLVLASEKFTSAEYHDLDDLIGNFVNQLANNFEAVRKHRKFLRPVPKTSEELEERLRKMLGQTKRDVIALSLDANHPGYVKLSYLLRQSKSGKSRSELIAVLPDQFKFRKKPFNTIDDALNYFKQSFTRRREEGQQQHYGRDDRTDRDYGRYGAQENYRGYQDYYDRGGYQDQRYSQQQYYDQGYGYT